MQGFKKKISISIIAAFFFLIAAEFSGVFVCHFEADGLFRVFSVFESSSINDANSNSKAPCPYDETPIEHAIHNAASGITLNTGALSYFAPTVLALSVPFVLFSSINISVPVIEERTFPQFLLAYHLSDRSPPVM